jgi:hypothetical protein
LYYRGPDGVVRQVAGKGDILQGSTIEEVGMAGTRSLNGLGKLLFRFRLADGRVGLALASLECPYREWVAPYGFSGKDIGYDKDPDGDGNSNGTEFLDGTDPSDGSSHVARIETAALNGEITFPQGMAAKDGGGTVMLTAVPEDGYVFSRWMGDATGSENPLPLVLDRSRRVTAVFLPPYEAWVRGFGLPEEETGRVSDPDQDGVSNADEFAEGTDPSDGASFRPRLVVTQSVGGEVGWSPAGGHFAKGEQVTLTAVADEGFVFLHWQGSVSGSANPLVVTMDGSKEVRAVFLSTSEPPPFEIAVDAPGLTFLKGGNAQWISEFGGAKVNASCGRSGVITHSRESWVQTTVSGPGTLRFWWKVSSEATYDFLEFWKDGVRQPGSISGEVDWVMREVAVTGAQMHSFRWRYVKDGAFSAGMDAGWLDGVEWIPETAFGAWANAAGLTGDDALAMAVPFHDGVPNLLKYAFNMNGGGSDNRVLTRDTGTAGLPSLVVESGGPADVFRFEFIRRIGSGLIYVPMKSPDLTVSSWSPLTVVPVVTPINAGWERVVYEEPCDRVVMPKYFGRVVVTSP